MADDRFTPDELGRLATKDDLNKEVARLDGRLDGVEKRIDGVERRLDVVEVKLDGLSDKMDERFAFLNDKMGERFARMDERFVNFGEKIDERFNNFEKHYATKADLKELKAEMQSGFTNQTRWLVGFLLVQTFAVAGLTASLVKLIP